MTSNRRFCLLIAAIVSIHSVGFAQEAGDGDDLASEFKKVKLIGLQKSYRTDSFECTLYSDADHKRMLDEYKSSKRPPGNRALYGTYLILEVKKDRLVIVPEIWTDHRRVRVIPLRYISDIYRAGLYAEAPK